MDNGRYRIGRWGLRIQNEWIESLAALRLYHGILHQCWARTSWNTETHDRFGGCEASGAFLKTIGPQGSNDLRALRAGMSELLDLGLFERLELTSDSRHLMWEVNLDRACDMRSDTHLMWALLDLAELRALRTADEIRAYSILTMIRRMRAPQHEFQLWPADDPPLSSAAWTARSRRFLRALAVIAKEHGETYLLGALPDDFTPGIGRLRLKARTATSHWHKAAWSKFPPRTVVHLIDAEGAKRVDPRDLA